MLQDLIELKKKLEKESKFVAFCVDHREVMIESCKEKTLAQIKEEENNDEVIEKCEELMKEVIKFFCKREIPFSSIGITTNVGFFVKKGFSEQLEVRKNKYNSESARGVFKENWAGNTLARYIPVTFGISWGDCYLPEEYIPTKAIQKSYNSQLFCARFMEYYARFVKTIQKIKAIKVSGIVDIDRFIHKLNEMGYVVEDGDNRKLENSVDYFNSCLNAMDAGVMSISIRANLCEKEKEEEKEKVK